MEFDEFGLIEPLLRAVESEGYEEPTPIQVKAIPHVMAGKDLLGCAQTGTGKTAAFALPILHMLAANDKRAKGGKPPIRSLVLTPTRELAAQIGESFGCYGRETKLQHAVVFGGVKQRPQTNALNRGVDILVATPGRLLDLMGQGLVDFRSLEVFVLDEADRMLDMGFIDEVQRIVRKLPKKRQTLFFSATMPKKIQSLADSILIDPIEIRVDPEAPVVGTVEQAVYFVERQDKQLLLHHLLEGGEIRRALVFTRTKRFADRVTLHLKLADISAESIHSDKTQGARIRALSNFKKGKTRVLVASDIAARGIDIDDISHVINYHIPNEPETYIHRIGRTGRAGAAGKALSFCDLEERTYLEQIERLVRQTIPAVESHPHQSPVPRMAERKSRGRLADRRRRRRVSFRRR